MSGRFRWASIRNSRRTGMKNTGTENYGGPLVTAGGLVFIGATNFDKKFRAFDKSTGDSTLGNHAALCRERDSGHVRDRMDASLW